MRAVNFSLEQQQEKVHIVVTNTVQHSPLMMMMVMMMMKANESIFDGVSLFFYVLFCEVHAFTFCGGVLHVIQ